MNVPELTFAASPPHASTAAFSPSVPTLPTSLASPSILRLNEPLPLLATSTTSQVSATDPTRLTPSAPVEGLRSRFATATPEPVLPRSSPLASTASTSESTPVPQHSECLPTSLAAPSTTNMNTSTPEPPTLPPTPTITPLLGTVSTVSFSTLVLGDSNLSTFASSEFFVYAAPNGRLSHLYAWMWSSAVPSAPFTKIFACLSTLDRCNRYSTLSTTTKSLLGRCHTRFPQATLFVILIRLGPDFSTDQRSTLTEFFNFLRNKHPSLPSQRRRATLCAR